MTDINQMWHDVKQDPPLESGRYTVFWNVGRHMDFRHYHKGEWGAGYIGEYPDGYWNCGVFPDLWSYMPKEPEKK
jgi:hypothetical protein